MLTHHAGLLPTMLTHLAGLLQTKFTQHAGLLPTMLKHRAGRLHVPRTGTHSQLHGHCGQHCASSASPGTHSENLGQHVLGELPLIAGLRVRPGHALLETPGRFDPSEAACSHSCSRHPGRLLHVSPNTHMASRTHSLGREAERTPRAPRQQREHWQKIVAVVARSGPTEWRRLPRPPPAEPRQGDPWPAPPCSSAPRGSGRLRRRR
mmetsp:Transcript_18646/g.51474  ORF Transcript_18646/g.51474 Transcript_18646/m.51474 type:complete len:207 (-) Transcript_18646:812-1432(-)